MFHGKHFDARLREAARLADIDLTARQLSQLGTFTDWLATEGAVAGGIGPVEVDRLTDRHIADSLVYATAWTGVPSRLLDVGSGVGLPGIPLAITHPVTAVTLLDRSEKRCSLARRAVRVLGLENVDVQQADARSIRGDWPVVVFRASLPPAAALEMARPLLIEDGRAVVGLSRRTAPEMLPVAPEGTAVDLLTIGVGVLDSPAWLLRMTLMHPTPPIERRD